MAGLREERLNWATNGLRPSHYLGVRGGGDIVVLASDRGFGCRPRNDRLFRAVDGGAFACHDSYRDHSQRQWPICKKGRRIWRRIGTANAIFGRLVRGCRSCDSRYRNRKGFSDAVHPGGPERYPNVVSAALVICGIGAGVVASRLFPAFRGLQSLLGLSIRMAKTEAIAHDRTLANALSADVENIARNAPYSELRSYSTRIFSPGLSG